MVTLPPEIKFEFFTVADIQNLYRKYILRKVNQNLDSRIRLYLKHDWQRWNTLVLLDGLKIVGMSTFEVKGNKADTAYTSVDKEYRNRGLGTFLVWKRMQIISGMGCRVISLSPYSDMGRISLAKNIWKFANELKIEVEDDYLDKVPYDSSDPD